MLELLKSLHIGLLEAMRIDNKFTFEYIDGQYGTYDDVITGTYIYNHPELILEIINDGTLKAFVREDGICLNEQNECSENSPELLLKQ